MQDKPVRWVQITLLYFGLTNAFSGVWALFMPHSFYDSFPGFGRVWVAIDGPYNQHLIQDVGGFFLALSVLSFLALLAPRLVSARATAICLLTFNLPHLLYHLKHLHMLQFIDQLGNVVTLSLAVLLLIPLLLHQPSSKYVSDPLHK